MSRRRNGVLLNAVFLALGVFAWRGDDRWLLILLAVGTPLIALAGIAVGAVQERVETKRAGAPDVGGPGGPGRPALNARRPKLPVIVAGLIVATAAGMSYWWIISKALHR